MGEIKRECPICDKEFDISDILLSKLSRIRDGEPTVLCPKCYIKIGKKKVSEFNRGFNLKTKYNLTVYEYNEMFKNQDYSCKICKQKQKYKRLAVDHDHETGKIRGLLCYKCNLMLGYAKDKTGTLQEGINYLNASRGAG